MSSSHLPYKQATNVERRTWDKSEYEAKAKARLATTENDTNRLQSSSKRQKISVIPLAESNSGNNDDSCIELKEEFQHAESGAQGPLNSKRAFLKARRGKVDLESKLGTTEIIHPDAAATSSSLTNSMGNSVTDGVKKIVNGVGWHCKICDCFLKDSLTYLDHINGRKHQRALGYSMRTAKSSTEEVVSKLDQLAKERNNCYETNNVTESKSITF
jgi:U4/U6.U5 tri-snRNP component SNU23